MKKGITLIALLVALAACESKNTNNEQQAEQETSANKTEVTTKKSSQALGIQAYLALKDAFVETNKEAVKKASKNLMEELDQSKTDLAIQTELKAISTADDIENQRKSFETLTNKYISFLKTNETETELYVQYCPMAFDNAGAQWISDSKEIRNPYFGDKMLKCGKVQEKL